MIGETIYHIYIKMSSGRFCGINQVPYGTDQACLTFLSQSNASFKILTQSTECERCDLVLIRVSAAFC